MSRARGSAVPSTILVLCTIMLVLSNSFADAAKFTVGDNKGWSFGVSRWPAGKKFAAGDVLVFKYAAGNHDVFVVDENSYNLCSPLEGQEQHATGNDEIVLKKGKNYFICSRPGHCDGGGMKILVDVE